MKAYCVVVYSTDGGFSGAAALEHVYVNKEDAIEAAQEMAGEFTPYMVEVQDWVECVTVEEVIIK